MNDQASSWVTKVGVGVVLLLIAVNLFSGLVAKKVGIPGVFEIEFGTKGTLQPTPQPIQAPAAPQPSMQPVAPLPSPQGGNPHVANPSQEKLPLSSAVGFNQPPAPTQNYACPTVAGIFWLAYPNTWYGPFGQGYAIGWYSAGGFGVWNPNISQTVNYPYPYRQDQRNMWMNLRGAPFNICIDSYGMCTANTGRIEQVRAPAGMRPARPSPACSASTPGSD
jgi:hypothetical protein